MKRARPPLAMLLRVVDDRADGLAGDHATSVVADDVHVLADPRTTVEEVLRAVSVVAPAAAAARWCDGLALDPAATVAASPLCGGADLRSRHLQPDHLVSVPPGLFEMRVIAGPGAGRTAWLPPGEHVLGRETETGGLLDHLTVSRRHMAVRVERDGSFVRDLGSANGTLLDGVPLAPDLEVPLPPGAVLAVGDLLLATGRAPAPVANLVRDASGMTVVNRTFRDLVAPEPDRIRVPTAPDEDETGGQSAVEAALLLAGPIAVAVPTALLMHNPVALLIGVLSPVMYGASSMSSRRSQRRRSQARARRHQAQIAQAMTRLEAAALDERDRARDAAPDPGALVLTALGRRTRLWERRGGAPDELVLRVGTHDRPTSVPAEGEVDLPVVAAVPATVPLGEVGVLGIAGAARDGALRSIVLQLAVLHSPADLSLTVLASPEASAGWDWVRWLPHLRSPDGTCHLATSPEQVDPLMTHLEAVLEARLREQAGRTGPRRWSPRHVLVVVEAPDVGPVLGLRRLATEGPAVGIDIVVSADLVERLPEERRATLRLDRSAEAISIAGGGGSARRGAPIFDVETGGAANSDDRTIVAVVERSGTLTGPLVPELVEPATAELAARALAPLHVAVGAGAGGSIPDEVRLVELAGDAESPAQVRALWDAAGDELRAVPIGAAEAGPLLLDLARRGPHGLVVGTTGSGKSELLLTLVASLALHHPPEVFTTVLVDFKGGTGLDALAPLPHCVGNVSNLEPLQAIRALESLDAELQRRQRLFAERYGEKEFDQAVAAARRLGDPPPARLLVLIDEFAVLREKLPDLVKRLEEIAVVGRSLGVHLLLATQQPGEISAKILDNSPLRIALRVEDPAASQQVLRRRDAADIPAEAKGRAFLSVGASLTAFQTARTTARRRDPDERPVPVARIETWDAPLRPRRAPSERVPIDQSELRALVDAAVAAHGTRPRPRPVFSEPLPPLVALESLHHVTGAESPDRTGGTEGAPGRLRVVVGLEDRPSEQAQVPFAFDLGAGGALVIGGPSSGRSSALRTVAAALARAFPSEQVHLHGIDGGTGQLLALEALPHTGVITGVGEPERIDRLLELLVEETSRRLERLQTTGASDLAEQWELEPSDRLPWLVLLVDGWERIESEVRERDGERTWRLLQRVAGEGRPAGIVPVVAGSWRVVLPNSPFANAGQRWVLGYPTASDHQLVDISPRLVPPSQPPGRALLPGRTVRHDGERAVPMPGLAQIAVIGGQAGGAAQAAALAALGRSLPRPAPGGGPLRVDRMPVRITLADALALEPAPSSAPARSGDLPVLAGVGGERLASHYIDLAATPAFVVAGPERSGRTTALIAMALQAADAGAALVLVHPRRSLHALQSHPATVASFTGAATLGTDPAERFEAVAGSCVLVIDDADGLRSLVERLGPAAGPDLRGILVAALPDTLREYWFDRLRSGRSGLILHPRGPYDGEQLGRRLTSSTVITNPKGRGHLLALGDDLLVQVPIPPG